GRLKAEQKAAEQRAALEARAKNIEKQLNGNLKSYENKTHERISKLLASKKDEKAVKITDSLSVTSPKSFLKRRKAAEIAPSLHNAIVALDSLGVECRYDVFHDRMLIGGHTEDGVDHVCLMIRDEILRRFGFDPGTQHIFDAVRRKCLQNRFDPVVDYLNSCSWDGVHRIDALLIVYLGAEYNALNRAIGRKTLLAAVRRAKFPGCKFDTIPVMDNSEQGEGKSTAIRILAGDENFSDQDILTNDPREQQELIRGVWIYELPEL